MKTTLLTAALCVGLLSPAYAATVGNGGTFCESLSLSGASSMDCNFVIDDLPNTPVGLPTITFLGSGTLLGGLIDAAGTRNLNSPDFGTITLSRDSTVTFTLVNSEPGFDARFTFGSLTADLPANGTVSGFFEAGTFFFGVEPAVPTNSAVRLQSAYALNVAAVPLPASVLLLLAGLGGLGIAARRRKSA